MQLVNKNKPGRHNLKFALACLGLFIVAFLIGRVVFKAVEKQTIVSSGEIIEGTLIDYSEIAAPKLYLHAYLGAQTEEGWTVNLSNFFKYDIDIEAVSVNEQIYELDDHIILPALLAGKVQQYTPHEILMPNSVSRENISSMALYFKTSLEPNTVKKMSVDLFDTDVDISNVPDFLTLGDIEKVSDIDFIDVIGDKITIAEGNWSLTETLVIPANYTVVAKGGVTINLSNDVSIISLSPVDFRGSEGAPVTIIGGGVNSGIAILQAKSRSKLLHTVFKNCSGPKYGAWTLTGSVVFYESPVDISYTEFYDNVSEDSLNIIRTNFTLKNSLISGTLSDAFDGDFVTGEVLDSEFRDCGNDCLDFSGADIFVDRLTITKSGDKGISIGEQSKAKLKNIKISNANIAIASKDASEIDAEKIEILNSNIGLAAYQKKPEYAGGNIAINQSRVENVNNLYMIETGSTLTGDLVAKQNVSYDEDVAVKVEVP